ncbi:MAG: hypothetical protein ACMUIL_10085 [bacterium]
MVRIIVSGSRPRTGKTALILRMIAEFPGFAVIQVKTGGLFSSVIAEPHGDEADHFRKNGAGHVLSIEADARDYADAIDQALCLVPFDIKVVIVEAYPYPEGVHGDVLIFMTDRIHTAVIPGEGNHTVMVDILEAIPDEKRANAVQYPLFNLHLMNNDPEEWARFMAYLRGLISRTETE